MICYKYMKKRFADEFFKTGSLRIGTLYDFKNTDGYIEAIRDSDEGSHYVTFQASRTLTFQTMTRSEKEFVSKFFNFGNSPSISIINPTLIQEISSPDCYIFCTSTVLSKKIMESFECDTCLEISNINLFLSKISKRIRHCAPKLSWSGNVIYLNKNYPYDSCNKHHPATTKNVDYEYQNEYRGVWEPKEEPKNLSTLTPLFIKVPEAIKLCRIIK